MAVPFLQAQLVKFVTERVLEALTRQIPREQLNSTVATLAAEEARAALHNLARSQAELAHRLDALESAARAQQARLEALERRPQRTWPLVVAAGSLGGSSLLLGARLVGLW